jgi:hypothetical protein
MLTHDKDIGNILKGNDSILQKRPKFYDISYGIHGKKT